VTFCTNKNVSGRAVSARYHDASLHQETEPHVSVWDRLGRASSECVLDTESRTLSKFGIQTRETKVHQQHGPVFPAAYSEQHSEIFQREVLAVGYRHRVPQFDKDRKPKSETITSTEPHIAYNLSRKRRYGMVSPNSGEFSYVPQYKQAEQDFEKPSLLSHQSTKQDIFSVRYMIVMLCCCHSCEYRFLTFQMMLFLLSFIRK